LDDRERFLVYTVDIFLYLFMSIEHNPDYIHHQNPGQASFIREIVFGAEDGMVSTLGAVTGIAAATQDLFTTVLSGFVIIAVESISMGVGSYLSSKSEKEIDERKLYEERIELREFPEDERVELEEMYIEDGWPKKLAGEMSLVASQNHDLFLQEMAYRELSIIPDNLEHPIRNGFLMWISYIVGGLIPLVPYLILSFANAIPVSICVTLIGLFVLGSYTTKYTKRSWWKAGLEMLGLASAAAVVGYTVGQAVDIWFLTK
jgi:vacuolar iron transporter family protein